MDSKLVFASDMDYFKNNKNEKEMWLASSVEGITDSQSLLGDKGGRSTLAFHPLLEKQIKLPLWKRLIELISSFL